MERATEALPPPSGLIPDIAALTWLDSYPAGVVRIHRAGGVMRQFPEPRFNVTPMLSGYP